MPKRHLRFKIDAAGHAITGGADTLSKMPNLEMTDGKLFNYDEDRLFVLGLLLESVGADAAVKLGSLAVWRASIEQLDR